MITAGGLYETSLSLERIEHLMSLRVVGLERVREIPALQAFCGIRMVSRDPFLLLKVFAPQAETVLRDGIFPLFSKKGLVWEKSYFLPLMLRIPPSGIGPARGPFGKKYCNWDRRRRPLHFIRRKKSFSLSCFRQCRPGFLPS